MHDIAMYKNRKISEYKLGLPFFDNVTKWYFLLSGRNSRQNDQSYGVLALKNFSTSMGWGTELRTFISRLLTRSILLAS
jgi:hypothetical protein